MARKLLENAAFFNRTGDIVRDDDGSILGFRERGSERGGRFNLVPVDAQGQSIDVEFVDAVRDERSAAEFLRGQTLTTNTTLSRVGDVRSQFIKDLVNRGLEEFEGQNTQAQNAVFQLSRQSRNSVLGGREAEALAPIALAIAQEQGERFSRLRSMGFNLVNASSQVPVFFRGEGLVDQTFDLSRADTQSLEANDPFIRERIDIESELSELRSEREARLQRRRDAGNPTGQRGLLSDTSRNQGRNLLSA